MGFARATGALAIDGVYTPEMFGATGNGTSDDVAAIQDALDDTDVRLLIFTGTYLLGSSTTVSGIPFSLSITRDDLELFFAPGAKLTSSLNAHAIFLSGAGKTAGIANWSTYVDTTWSALNYKVIGAVAKGSKSITCTTPADAGTFTVGAWIYIRTGQVQSGGATNFPDAEYNRVAAVDAGTGVITLQWPTSKPYNQEYYVSGTSGVTTTTVTANPAILGVSMIGPTGESVLENITLTNLRAEMTGNREVLVGGQQFNYLIDNPQITTAKGFQSQGHYRNVRVNGGHIHVTGASGTIAYGLTADVGSGDVHWNDVLLTGERPVKLHVHEGTYGVKGRAISIRCAPSATGGDYLISVRSRAYDNSFAFDTLIGGGPTTAYVDELSLGGVKFAFSDHLPSSSGDALAVAQATDGSPSGVSVFDLTNAGQPASQAWFSAVNSPTERLAVELTKTRTNAGMGTLPARSVVTGAFLQVTQAFDSSGTDTISCGYDADNIAFFTATDVSTTGIKTVTMGSLLGYNATARDVEAYYVAGGGAPTTGKAVVVLEYYRVQYAV